MHGASPADIAGGGNVCCFIPCNSSAMIHCVENPLAPAFSSPRIKSRINPSPVLGTIDENEEIHSTAAALPSSRISSEELCEIAGTEITERFLEGWKLLHRPCPVCGIPAMTKDGLNICVLCGPLPSPDSANKIGQHLDFDAEVSKVEPSEGIGMPKECAAQKESSIIVENSSCNHVDGSAGGEVMEQQQDIAIKDVKMKDAAINTDLAVEEGMEETAHETVDEHEIDMAEDVLVDDKATPHEDVPMKEENRDDYNEMKRDVYCVPEHRQQTKGVVSEVAPKEDAAINATDLSTDVAKESILKDENVSEFPQNVVSLSVVISSDGSNEEENLANNDDDTVDDSSSEQDLIAKAKEVEENVNGSAKCGDKLTTQNEMALFIASRDSIVPKLNELILSGWIILSETCDDCGLSLLRSKSGEQACAACGPVQTAEVDHTPLDANDAFHLEVGKRVLAGWNILAGSSCSLCERPIMRCDDEEECIICGKKVQISLELPASFELTSRKSVDGLLSRVKAKLEQYHVAHNSTVDQPMSDGLMAGKESTTAKVEPGPIRNAHTPDVTDSEQKLHPNLLVNTSPEWTLPSGECGIEAARSKSRDDGITGDTFLMHKCSFGELPESKLLRQSIDGQQRQFSGPKNVVMNVSSPSPVRYEHGSAGAVRSAIMAHRQRLDSQKYSKDMFKGWVTLSKSYCKCGGPIMRPPHCREVFCVNFICPSSFYQTRRKVGNVDDYLRRTASEDNCGRGNVSMPNQQTIMLQPRESIRSYLVNEPPSISTKNTVEAGDFNDEAYRQQNFVPPLFPDDEDLPIMPIASVNERSEVSPDDSRASRAAAVSLLDAIFMGLNRIEKAKEKIMPVKMNNGENKRGDDNGTEELIEKLAVIAVTKM